MNVTSAVSRVLGVLGVVLLATPLRAVPPASQPAATDMEFDRWWTALAEDDAKSVDAVLNFVDHPAETVAFMKPRLHPLNLSAEDLESAVADLANEDEAVWKRAFEKLEYFDPRLAKTLPEIFQTTIDPQARARLAAVMNDFPAAVFAGKRVDLMPTGAGQFNFRVDHGSYWAEARIDHLNWGPYGTSKKTWTQAVKALVVLRHIGTPEAMAIVSDMATGHPDAAPTRVAKGETIGPATQPATDP